ncbi:hypothetical protein [Deinococcus sonorensis]|uniref:Uncharacterized protein n=2 Tax=Deinococcus sonorensis TaxID=309891 RepID=A0AAU7UAN6_9DEIO
MTRLRKLISVLALMSAFTLVQAGATASSVTPGTTQTTQGVGSGFSIGTN